MMQSKADIVTLSSSSQNQKQRAAGFNPRGRSNRENTALLLVWTHCAAAVALTASTGWGQSAGGSSENASSPLVFERTRIGDVTFEATAVFDVNNDGRLDIVSGEYWFEGPEFEKSHKICDIMRVDDYYDDFSNYPLDVNGDGYLDIITGGWWGATLTWRENPKGESVEWKSHAIDKCGNIETTRFWDVDGDGRVEVCPNAGGNIVAYRLAVDGAGKAKGTFTKHVLKQGGVGHGLGFGDINGDGRGDFVAPDGWLEAPLDPWKDAWTWHADFKLGTASVPILVHDVNADGVADLIVGMGHGYGLAWYEQKLDSANQRSWIQHDIDTDRSQYHDLLLADLDNDGKPELLTGKRYRAHLGRDPGAGDPVGLYAFWMDGGQFRRFTIDYGPADKASGAGIYLWVTDLDGNGWMDIVAPGKEGLHLFRNRGRLPG